MYVMMCVYVYIHMHHMMPPFGPGHLEMRPVESTSSSLNYWVDDLQQVPESDVQDPP